MGEKKFAEVCTFVLSNSAVIKDRRVFAHVFNNKKKNAHSTLYALVTAACIASATYSTFLEFSPAIEILPLPSM